MPNDQDINLISNVLEMPPKLTDLRGAIHEACVVQKAAMAAIRSAASALACDTAVRSRCSNWFLGIVDLPSMIKRTDALLN
jgi:hypothetical protein